MLSLRAFESVVCKGRGSHYCVTAMDAKHTGNATVDTDVNIDVDSMSMSVSMPMPMSQVRFLSQSEIASV